VTDIDATVDSTTLRRSTRSIIRPVRYGYHQDYQKKVSFAPDKVGEKQVESHHNLPTNMHFKSRKVIEYSLTSAQVAARFMTEANEKVSIQGASFAQQYSLQKGMQKFGKKGADAVTKELDQLHKRNCFVPIDVSKLTTSERKKAQHALMLLTEKHDGSVKGRCVYNGKPTRKWLDKDDAASPTVATESIMLTATIDAKEGRDVMTADVPNAFIQTKLPEIKDGEERIVMKITGVLVDLIVEMAPDVYGPFVVMEHGKKVLYLHVLMVLYGMLAAALLWYRKY